MENPNDHLGHPSCHPLHWLRLHAILPSTTHEQGPRERSPQDLVIPRNLPEDHYLVQDEFLEIKADVEFETAISAQRFPALASSAGTSIFRRELAQYSNIFRSRELFKRVAIAVLVMFFQ